MSRWKNDRWDSYTNVKQRNREKDLETIKPWLEILYLLSGPAIAIIGYFALGHIRVAKEQIAEQRKSTRISSKRDALKLTADQVAFYCDKIIPLQNILDEKIKHEGLTDLEKFKVEFDAEFIRVIPPEEDLELDNFMAITDEFVDVANAMESFSTYFVSGVADEKVAYLSLGATFCDYMKKISPVLIPLSEEGKHFSATLRLYGIWGARMESEALEQEKMRIEEKLNSHKQKSVKVVGADI